MTRDVVRFDVILITGNDPRQIIYIFSAMLRQ